VESALGAGATFYFSIPDSAPSEAQAEVDGEAGAAQESAPEVEVPAKEAVYGAADR
jgi:hypothetical protein